MDAIEATHLGRRYSGLSAQQDCNLTRPAGKIAGLVGPNGASKATLLQLALGQLVPTAGSLRLFRPDPRTEIAQCSCRCGSWTRTGRCISHLACKTC